MRKTKKDKSTKPKRKVQNQKEKYKTKNFFNCRCKKLK